MGHSTFILYYKAYYSDVHTIQLFSARGLEQPTIPEGLVQVTVTGWNFSKHVKYEVTITLDDDIYCSFRFSELYDLYRSLDKKDLTFPSKNYLSWLRDANDKKECELRREQLDRFFKEVCKYFTWKEQPLQQFLRMAQQRHREALKTPRIKPMKDKKERLDYVIA